MNKLRLAGVGAAVAIALAIALAIVLTRGDAEHSPPPQSDPDAPKDRTSDPDAPKDWIETTHVGGSVYMLTSHGRKRFDSGNIAVLVGDDGALMVDAKIVPLAPLIKDAIRKLGGDGPKYILNTHLHDDHTSGNSEYRPESTIIAHANVRARLRDKPEDVWPVITFDRSLTIHMNGETIRMLHLPTGHTDGDAVVYFESAKVVHMGDLYFSGVFPFIDLGSGGTVQGYIANVKKVMAELPADIQIIPGHGPLSALSDLKNYVRMLEQTTQSVTARMKAGETLEQIKRAGLSEEWDGWSWRFITTERWIETIYTGLSK